MKLQDVAVVDFNFMPGIKGPTVKAMAQFTLEGVHEPQIAWVELTEEEIKAIVAVARVVEHRLVSGESPLPEPVRERLGFKTK